MPVEGTLPGVVLRVWVSRRSSRERIGRLADGGFRAFVAAEGPGGENARLIGLLAARLRVPVDSVEIISGTSKNRKLVQIGGITEAEVRERIPSQRSGHFMDAAGRRRRTRRLATRAARAGRVTARR